MKIRFIGDVHGKFKPYRELIRNVPVSMQVGDMGVGFRNPRNGDWSDNPPYDAMAQGDHTFIRGNHDNPGVCRRHQFYIHDGTVKNGFFCVGGGMSIDRAHRMEGYSYWKDEELSYSEFLKVINIYDNLKPDFVMTHDISESVANAILAHFNRTKFNDDPSITRGALEQMLSIHQPKVWIFGHWHVDLDIMIGPTRFICLDELSYLDFDSDDFMSGTIVPRR